MGLIRVANFDGLHGAIGDLPVQSIPPNIFTDVRNVRFRDGYLGKCKGFESQHGTPPIAPYYILTSKDNSATVRAFLAGTGKIYALSNGAYTNVTRAVGGDYSATANNVWTGTVLHGVAVLNNGVDVPQSWDAGTSKFIDLPNWPASTTARVVRSVENFLFALDITKSGTRYPHNILWSHPADPGSVPASWNTADTTKDAGESPLSKSPGFAVDALALGNLMVIYKETSCYVMQYVGLNWIFKFGMASLGVGMLTRNCAQEYKNRHLVLTQDDVVLFDGRTYESVIERRWRTDLFNNISGADYEKCFVVAMPQMKEYWICVPTAVGYPPNLAYVWKPDTNSWSKRDIPFLQYASYDFPPGKGSAVWNDQTTDWDSLSGGWSPFEGYSRAALAVSPTNTKVYTIGATNTIDGELITAYAQHNSYDFADPNVKDSAFRVKHLSKIRPRFKAPVGTQIKFTVGTQMHIDDDISWAAEQIFTVGTNDELCWTANGRYISWKIYSDSDCEWELEALEFLVQYGGYY